MTTPLATWTPPGGRGGVSRPQAPARVVPELEPGLAVVRFAHDTLGLDASWSVREGRGFMTRTGGLTQRVWAEPGHDDMGIRTYRVHAEMEMVRGIGAQGRALSLVNSLNATGSLGALVVDPTRGRVTHRVSLWVHAATLPWVGHLFATAVALQASEAVDRAGLVAAEAEGTIDRSRHPGAAMRILADVPLDIARMVAIAGREPSCWADGSLVRARQAPGQGVAADLDRAADEELSIAVPFGAEAAILRATTREAHPTLGNGLLVRLTLPNGATETADAATAAALNRLELASWSRAHLVGAWVAVDGRIEHIASYPNLVHTADDVARLLQTELLRASWAAAVLT